MDLNFKKRMYTFILKILIDVDTGTTYA